MGGVAGGGQAAGKRLAVGDTGEDPFEGEPVVEREEEAEALGEFLVAHGGGVREGDAVVGQPALDAAGTGAYDGFAVRQGAAEKGVVERGVEVRQARTDAQAGGQGAGRGESPYAVVKTTTATVGAETSSGSKHNSLTCSPLLY